MAISLALVSRVPKGMPVLSSALPNYPPPPPPLSGSWHSARATWQVRWENKPDIELQPSFPGRTGCMWCPPSGWVKTGGGGCWLDDGAENAWGPSEEDIGMAFSVTTSLSTQVGDAAGPQSCSNKALGLQPPPRPPLMQKREQERCPPRESATPLTLYFLGDFG